MTGMLSHLSCTLSPAFVLRRSSMWGLPRSPQCHRNRCAVCLPASLLGCHSSICAQLSAPSACLGATTQQSTHLVLPVAVPPRCCMRKGVLRAARGANPPLPLRVQRGGRPHPPHQIHCVQQMLGLQHKSVIVSLMHPAHRQPGIPQCRALHVLFMWQYCSQLEAETRLAGCSRGVLLFSLGAVSRGRLLQPNARRDVGPCPCHCL